MACKPKELFLNTIFTSLFKGKMAWQKHIQDEAEFGGIQQDRGARQSSADYVPTFYTAHQQSATPIVQAQPVYFESQGYHPYSRTARDAYFEQPLYYYSY